MKKETVKHRKRQDTLGEKPLESIGWPRGPEQLDRNLAGLLKLLSANPVPGTPCFAAFEALSLIGGYWSSDAANIAERDPDWGLKPMEPVRVPWWVIRALALAWARYRSAAQETTLGKAFGLEPVGRGKHSTVSVLATRLRDLRIALEVGHRLAIAEKENRKLSQAAAILDVADSFALEEATVRRAWKKNRVRVMSMYRSWQDKRS